MSGIERIEVARIRQISHHGYEAAHDDTHTNGELAAAAEAYLSAYGLHCKGFCVEAMDGTPLLWPFEYEAWRWDSGNMIHNLERAGAFIAAEIDRIQRKDGAK